MPHSPPGDWSNYVKAAASRLVERYGAVLSGMDVLYEGDIPDSAGLSSSSALVVASAVSLLVSNRLDYDPVELAEMMAEGERYVGTQGGGMDQAVCLLGKEGKAVRLDFFPLRFAYVDFPSDYSIIVAHSLIRAAKTENALLRYNRRPAECRLAVAIVNSVFTADPPLSRLGDLLKYDFFAHFRDIPHFLDRVFPCESYSLHQIAEITGEEADTLVGKYLMTRQGVPMPEPEDGFRIRQRVRHVLSEAERVDRSCRALEAGNAAEFGRLMNESHQSCDINYGLSTPELNTLTAIMREAGSLGARLTGAGFGGCAVALVHDSMVEKVLDTVRQKYYREYISKTHPALPPEETLFVVKPSQGATIRPWN
ncbi:MAG: galactokinase [Candidatus Latescibacterota bacterium]